MTSIRDTQAIRGGLDWLALWSNRLAAFSVFGLVLVQGWQVIARYVLNNSPSWTEPATIVLLSMAMSFGAAAAVHERRHFGFFLLAEAMQPTARRLADATTALTIAGIGAVLAWWSSILFVDGLDVRTAGAPLPQSLPYLPLAMGGGLMALFSGWRLIDGLRGSAVAHDRVG